MLKQRVFNMTVTAKERHLEVTVVQWLTRDRL